MCSNIHHFGITKLRHQNYKLRHQNYKLRHQNYKLRQSLGNCRVSRLGGRGRGFEVEVEVKKSRSRLKSRGRGFEVEVEVKKSRLKSRKHYVNYSFTNIFPLCILHAFTCLLLFLSTTKFHGKKLFLLHLDSQM